MKEQQKEIQELCKQVLELPANDTGDTGSGAECPFCRG